MIPLQSRFRAITVGFCFFVLVATASSAWAAGKPLKVFILAGQSNMQGHANVSTFDEMADDPKTAPLLKEMRDKDGKPTVCEKVWITSVGCLGDAYADMKEQKGKLTAGFGAGREQHRARVHLRPHDGETPQGAGADHQDFMGWAEPAHRLPPAQCGALCVE